jgi:hypothetical protein
MAIIVEQHVSDSRTTNDTSFLFDAFAAPASGNLAVAFIAKDGNGDAIVKPTGANNAWNEVFTAGGVTDGSSLSRYQLYWMECGASEPASYTWTCVTAERWSGTFMELSGAALQAPEASNSSAGNDTTPISPDITTLTANALVFAGFGNDGQTGSITLDAALSNTANYVSASTAGTGCGAGSEIQASADATGTYSHTISTRPWLAFTAAFAEAGGSTLPGSPFDKPFNGPFGGPL